MGLVYYRKTKETKDNTEFKAGYANFLYNTILGRIILKIVIMPFFSGCLGKYCDSPRSAKIIDGFIKDNHIDMTLFEKEKYKTFNEFFCRKKIITKDIKTNFKDSNAFISPADSKVLCYKMSEDLKLNIKDSQYDLSELLNDDKNLDSFKNGYVLVFRLAVDDYHRYCFIDDGKVKNQYEVKGKLHTVSSVSKRYKIYKENHRIINKISTKNFGDIYQIEVGALLVGKIINNNKTTFKKGEEKGYFLYGGSTIVIIINDNVLIDEDILQNSEKDIETKVEYGEKIGVKK